MEGGDPDAPRCRRVARMRCVVSVPTLNTQRGLRKGMGETRGRRSMGAPEEAAVPSSRPPEPGVKAHERSRGPIDGVATSFPNSAVGGAEPNGNSGKGARSIRDGSEGIVSHFACPVFRLSLSPLFVATKRRQRELARGSFVKRRVVTGHVFQSKGPF